MNIKNLHKALPVLFKTKITPLIIGPKGIGKSQAIKQYADENGLGFIDLRLGQMADAGDLLGLLDFVKDSTGQSIASRHMKPAFFPTEGRGILFLDEINRATRDVQQAVFQLVLDGKIHEYTLPTGWAVVAAANPPSADYIVSDIDDKAFLSRFCQVSLHTPVGDWVEYAKARNLDAAVTAFIEDQPNVLDGKDAEYGLYEVTPCRRSWEMVSRIVAENPDPAVAFELIQGCVGAEAAVAFQSFQSTFDRSISLSDVLDNYPTTRERILKLVEKNRLDMLNSVAKVVVEHTQKDDTEYTPNQVANIVQLLLDLPMEVGFSTVRDLIEAGLDPDIGENPALITHFTKVTAALNEIDKSEKEAKGKATKSKKAAKAA